jgi:type IV pilus assembly protein PilA
MIKCEVVFLQHIKTSKSSGLTLIELLVVIGIIAILASIIFVSTNTGRQKARDTKRISDIQAIILALDQYVEANTVYPDAIANLHPQYLSSVPQDPISGAGYRYGKCIPAGGSEPTRVHLGMDLEDISSSSLQNDSDYNSSAPGAGAVCGGLWTASFNGVDPIYDLVR